MFKCLPRRRLSILPQLSVQVLGVVVSLAPFGCLVSSPVESPGPAGEGRVLPSPAETRRELPSSERAIGKRRRCAGKARKLLRKSLIRSN